MSAKILIVDDESAIRFTLRSILEDHGFEVAEAEDGEAALDCIQSDRFDLVISDLRMPRLDGMGLLSRLHSEPAAPCVIIITAHGSERHAVEAIKGGAYDYFRKPFDNDELITVNRALANVKLKRDNEQLQDKLHLSRSLVFECEAMGRLATLLSRVAPRDVTVLIRGETGTGKERVAQALVRASSRAHAPYLTFNCAALTPDLAQAELFGHTRGAFTGADKARAGLFRRADGGTVLLDEIGELDLGTQAKLLRVLQEGEVQPIGQEQPTKIDVRILAATHRDLPAMVQAGTFREDLYYRVKVVELSVPPLRERKGDIAALTEHFVDKFRERFQIEQLVVPAEMLARLEQHHWPGNVRELENCIESLVALSDDGVLDLSLLPDGDPPGKADSDEAAVLTLRQRMTAFERGLVNDALASTKNNVSAAARKLGVSRVTLHDKLKKYGS